MRKASSQQRPSAGLRAGQLKKPNRSTRLNSGTSLQRPLPARTVKRSSDDILKPSPEKRPQVLPPPAQQTSGFSPLRRSERNTRAQQTHSSNGLGASGIAQEGDGDISDAEATTRYRDPFPDAVVQRYQGDAAEGGTHSPVRQQSQGQRRKQSRDSEEIEVQANEHTTAPTEDTHKSNSLRRSTRLSTGTANASPEKDGVPEQQPTGQSRKRNREDNEEDDGEGETVPKAKRARRGTKRRGPSEGDGRTNNSLPRPARIPPNEVVFPQSRAGRSKKRSLANPADGNESETAERSQEESDSEEPPNLYGQGVRLQQIFEATGEVGRQATNRIKGPQELPSLADAQVRAIMRLCTTAKHRFSGLQAGTGTEDPAPVLAEISERVDGLQGRNDEFPTDFTDQDKITDIYAHLIPRLVKLLNTIISCYLKMDKERMRSDQLSLGHLKTVQSFTSLILQLGKGAGRLFTARPDSSHAVVRSVKNGLLVPLRGVDKAFQLVIAAQERSIRFMKDSQKTAKEAAEKRKLEEEEARVEARFNQRLRKWQQLHEERRIVEGGIPSLAKLKHLRLPTEHLDTDQNGELFSRLELFHRRAGPSPGTIAAARQNIWPEQALKALELGLTLYAGPLVYEKIIRRFCSRDGLLNPYNVTEIVTWAADLKDYVVKQQGDQAAEWTKSLFDWTVLHGCGDGKENDGNNLTNDHDNHE